MTFLQIANLLLVWFFFGFLCSHLAKKRGKNPTLWFIIGTLCGLFGLIIFFVTLYLPQKKVQPRKAYPPSGLKKDIVKNPRPSESHFKVWYYLDQEHRQVGPVEFTDLTDVWKKRKIQESSFVWSDGMSDWKKVEELPQLLTELKK